MTNKVKILRYIAMNGPTSMDTLVKHPITEQSRGAFKQYVYQLKNAGDLENVGGQYMITARGRSYLKAAGNLPATEPPDDARLDVCPDCSKVTNLEKHRCPNGDPLELDDDEEEEVDIRTMKRDPLEQMAEPHDDSADFAPPQEPEHQDTAMTQVIETLREADEPITPNSLVVPVDDLDVEIDAMRSLLVVMTHFERQGLSNRQRRRITEWFSDRFGD